MALEVVSQLLQLSKDPENRPFIVTNEGCLPGLVMFLEHENHEVVIAAVEVYSLLPILILIPSFPYLFIYLFFWVHLHIICFYIHFFSALLFFSITNDSGRQYTIFHFMNPTKTSSQKNLDLLQIYES